MRHKAALLWALLFMIPCLRASCPPGCECDEQNKEVTCREVRLGFIPVFLNPELRILRLINCSVSQPDSTTLRLYEDLEELDLSNNQIVNFPDDIFEVLQNLKILRLKQNLLADLDRELFSDLVKLEILDLSQNRISTLPSLSHLHALRNLNLSENVIRDMDPSALASLSQLTTLDLSQNQLRKVSPSLFLDLSKLGYLTLAGNYIEQITYGTFSSQNELVSLNMSKNALRNLETGSFTGLRNLKALDLSNNQLTAVPRQQWIYVAQLANLYLSGNPINSIEGRDLAQLTNLDALIVTDMPSLEMVKSEALQGLCALRALHISRCPRLHSISPTAFSNCTKLVELGLAKNALRSWAIPRLNWAKLKTLDLTSNPWQCDCLWMPTLRNLVAPLKSLNKVRCAGPEQMAGLELAKAALQCQSTLATLAKNSVLWSNLPVLGAVAGSALLVISLAMIVCIRRFCCEKKTNNSTKNSRMPLYGGSSSFSGSIIYDKPEPVLESMDTSQGYTSCQRYVSALPQGRNDFYGYPANDYYSSLVLLPNSCQSCTYASPYASSSAYFPNSLNRTRTRPPSFMAPPPPPSCPPPPISTYHKSGVPL